MKGLIKHIIIIIILIHATKGKADDLRIEDIQAHKQYYKEAFALLNGMLNQSKTYSFKEAVFAVENAYHNNRIDSIKYNAKIEHLAKLSQQLLKTRTLIYDLDDKKEVELNYALFALMTDSIPILVDTNEIVKHPPFSYDFNDIWGKKDWSNMFVTKLLSSHKGNCHSLPFLYKILAEEIGAQAHLAIAPNHFYIKHYNKANGWYNTELTSAMFPIDAWLMASGYVHLDAIVNKLYMEALNNEQAIAICMIDLAKGYERQFKTNNHDFVLQCCDTALKYYPNYINALLLKAETKKKQYIYYTELQKIKDSKNALQKKRSQELLAEMNQLYGQIHQLGYRRMPEEMYIDWLSSLKTESDKYENKKMFNFKVSDEKN